MLLRHFLYNMHATISTAMGSPKPTRMANMLNASFMACSQAARRSVTSYVLRRDFVSEQIAARLFAAASPAAADTY
jgi:hypothetical protein